MRVLFSTIGAVGHIYPMVPLARALLAAGHEVRWGTSAEMCPTIVEAGIPAFSAGLSNSDWRDERNRRMRELADVSPAERTNQLARWMFGELLAPAMLGDLLEVVRSWPPTIFIHYNMELAAPIAAKAVGAVHIAHSFGPLTPEERVLAIADSARRLWRTADTSPPRYGGLYDHLYLDICPRSIQPTASDHVLRRQAIRPVPYAPPVDEVPPVQRGRARARPGVRLATAGVWRCADRQKSADGLGDVADDGGAAWWAPTASRASARRSRG